MEEGKDLQRRWEANSLKGSRKVIETLHTRGAPLIIAHRGFTGIGENNLRSFIVALDRGVDMIEVDVRISGDGVLVAHHDPEIGDLKISEATVEELRRVGIEDLEYIVGALGGEALYMIDIKIPDVIGELRRIILKYGLQERAILAGDPEAVKALGDELNILMAPSFGLCNWGYSLKRTLEMGAQILNENKVCYDPEAHREALNHGLLISVWTVNDPHEIEDFALRGVHFLVTDNIEEAVKIVRRLRELTKHDLGWCINA